MLLYIILLTSKLLFACCIHIQFSLSLSLSLSLYIYIYIYIYKSSLNESVLQKKRRGPQETVMSTPLNPVW